MSSRGSKVIGGWLTASLLFAGCGSPDSVAEGVAVESTSPTSSITSTTPTTSAVSSSVSSTTESEVEPDPDPDRSPPTTETEGLASDAEAAEASEDLTCWRVEDFGMEAAERWVVINDGVMGGLSEGSVTFGGGVATFTGTINTNGGGFSMIRTSVFRNGRTLADALEEAEYLRFRVRSANGRGYELTAQDSTSNNAVMHFEPLVVSDDSGWQEALVPLSDLEARAFGNQQPGLTPFELEQISTLGIILADGMDGPFSLAIDRMDACST